MARSKWINKKQANRKVRPAAQNPSVTKFRDQAKLNPNKMANKSTKSMKLTYDNLAIHNAIMADKSTPMDQPSDSIENLSLDQPQDNKSMSSLSIGETELNRFKGFTNDQVSDAQTFATCFTNCTNASFGYFLQKFNSNSSVHKEMLSILAAATDIINEQKDEETDEKYFDLLTNSIYTAESTLALTANIVLLYYVIKRMNQDQLRIKFSSFQQLTTDLLKKYLNSSNVSFVKFLLKCYFIFLKEQEAQEWENSITRTSYVNNLLVLTVHPKSRIRKVAKDCVSQLFNKLEECDSEHNEHPIYECTIEFTKRKIKETSGEDITDALYVLNVWKEIIHHLPIAYLKSTCEQLIGLLALGNVLIFTNCMQILENLFKSNSKNINSDLNYKVILALYDNQPALTDHQPLLAWCSVTKFAELNLFNLNKALFIEHLLKLFNIYFNCLQSDNQVQRSFACQCINELLEKTIQAKDDFNTSVFIAIGESLRSFLAFKHASIWRLIIRIYSTFFKLTGKQFDDTINRSFLKLLDLKGVDCEEAKNLRFDYPIRSLIQHHGVEFVLDKIKLEPDSSAHTISNLWLIEILRQNVKNDKIANFSKYILTQAEKICSDFKTYNINNDSPWLFAYVQFWSLLPVFFNEPTDIQQNLKTIARKLGDALTNAPPLRSFIMKALRQLISKSKGDDQIEIAKYSKNYIPILLNLYVSDLTKDKAMKTTIYQTLSMFFSINDPTTTETIYSKVLENKDAEKDEKKKGLYLDILRCIVCNLKNEEKIVNAFEFGLKLSQSGDDKLEQKKAFRLVEELIKSPNNFKVINDHYMKRGESFYENIINYYSQNYSSVSIFAAQASFTNIIQHVINEQFKNQPLSVDEFKNRFAQVIVNVLQSKKSAKLSCSVFSVLESCIGLMCDRGADRAISVFVELLQEKDINIDRKATLIFILHTILIKHKDKINNQSKASLITALLNNLSNENRKVVNVILLFLNDWFKVSNKDEMLPYITKFIDYLNSIENPCSPQFKYKVKNIIEKILKKFGAEIVTKMLDNKYQRLIRIMLKNDRRDKKDKKPRRGSVEELDDDEDAEEMNDDELREFRKSKSNKRWRFDEDEDFDGFHIFNDDIKEDEPMEETTAQKQTTAKKVTFNQILRINKEGQIMAEDQEQTPNQVTKKEKSNDSDSESSDDETDVKTSKKNRSQKPKRNIRERIMDKYKRKRGIHRDLNVTGAEYRSTKSGGDMKKRGMPDPYAYIGLDKSVLSKRKALKNKTKFQNIVKSAFRGAQSSKKSFKKK